MGCTTIALAFLLIARMLEFGGMSAGDFRGGGGGGGAFLLNIVIGVPPNN